MRGLRGLEKLRAALLQHGAASRGALAGSTAEAAWHTFRRASIVALARSGVWDQVASSLAHAAETQHLKQQQQRRHLGDSPQAQDQELNEGYFNKIVDQTLEDLLERVECFVEELDLDDSDVEYSQGVLTVRLGELGTYVINKQTPNRQIWMSSPISGPVRYDWAPGKWVYHRDGHDLHSRVSDELKQLTGHELDLSPCFACGKLNTCGGEQCHKESAS